MSVTSYGGTSISDHSIIFCSHSVDGDSVEVVSMDNYEIVDDDEESMDQSVTVTILPTVAEEEEQEDFESNPAVVDDLDDEPAKLVLTESLDEDGFEITFERKNNLASLLASPREVLVDL